MSMRGVYNIRAKQSRRKELRKSLTPVEAILWKCLQRRQLDGKKFRRQQSIGPYIVDFCCPESRVIVELDGAQHYTITGAEYDAKRSEYLTAQGFKVIRFENRLVHEDLEYVLEVIRGSL